MKIVRRSEILAAVSGADDKTAAMLHHLEQLLPVRNIPLDCRPRFSTLDIASAIEAALSGAYDIESIPIEDAGPMLLSDKALTMKLEEQVAADTDYVGEVFGKGCEDSGNYYAFVHNSEFEAAHPIYDSVGLVVTEDVYFRILNNEAAFEGYDWFAVWLNGAWLFHKTDERHSTITVTEQFSFVTKAFSRNTGLMETDTLKGKVAILGGLGSVGSYVAMMLVKAGVSDFILCDGDTLEVHNFSRHWLGMTHLGQYKVDAMAHEIRCVNPNARVKTFRGMIQEAPDSLFADVVPDQGIVITSGDNRKSGEEGNMLAQRLGLPFVAIGCWTRASSGEIFTWHKDTGLPTYGEAFDGLISDERDTAHRAYFGEEAEAEIIRFEPGIYTDITFITTVGIKLALDLLCLNESGYTTRVLEHMTNYTLVCNTNKTELGGERACLFPYPLRITDIRDGIWLQEAGDAACLMICLN